VIEPWPAGLSEGAATVVELVRAAWREQGRTRAGEGAANRIICQSCTDRRALR